MKSLAPEADADLEYDGYKMRFQAFHKIYSYLNSKVGPYQFLSMQLFSLLRYSQSMKSFSLCLIIRKLELR